MEYRRLGRTGLKVSELCLGTMTFGWTSDEKNAYQVFDTAFKAGINFIDTADVYSRWAPNNPGGVAETYIGNWLNTSRKTRDQIVLATKVRGRMWDGPNGDGLSRVHIIKAAEDSLRRLHTDYIDLYQCHAPDDTTPLEETLRALDDLVRAGKVRYIGLSNYPAWQVEKSLWISDKYSLASVVSIQPHYNLVWRAEFERELMPLCEAEGIGVIPYSPLQGGFLTGKYRKGQPMPHGARGEGNERMTRFVNDDRNMKLLDEMQTIATMYNKSIAQVAIAWMLSNPTITSPIIGANTASQLGDLLSVIGFRLSVEEKKLLDELTAWQLTQ
ncbi:MAG: aldo/keto reductase [Chloroflexi bacterium]|nr:aldo/keto reductase [Chloroflexota bacterium]